MPIPKRGESEKDFVHRAIPFLIDEGYPQKQAIAIAYSMYKNKKGGRVIKKGEKVTDPRMLDPTKPRTDRYRPGEDPERAKQALIDAARIVLSKGKKGWKEAIEHAFAKPELEPGWEWGPGGYPIRTKGSGINEKTMERLKELKAIPLSDTDVLKLVDGKAKVLLYSDLANYDTIEDALGPNQAIFLLYETQKDYGHWVSVFKEGNTIEFFDPYGIFVDNELEWIPSNFREVSGQKYPQLSYLLSKVPEKINLIYNNHKFQKTGKGINSCGRWSALRLAYRDMSLDKFKDLFLGAGSDDMVTLLTTPDLSY